MGHQLQFKSNCSHSAQAFRGTTTPAHAACNNDDRTRCLDSGDTQWASLAELWQLSLTEWLAITGMSTAFKFITSGHVTLGRQYGVPILFPPWHAKLGLPMAYTACLIHSGQFAKSVTG
jgi:hypothetical protein